MVKLSIIVPVYNVEKYLSTCIDSLLNQTLEEIEIILIDDNSPDNCPEICDEYAKQDERIKVVHKQNEGLGYARNSGIEIAVGEYLTFVDSDDYVELNAYQNLYAKLMDTKADVIYFNFQRFNDQGNNWNDASIFKEKMYQTKDDVHQLMLDMIANPPSAKNDRNIQVSSCCAVYRREPIKKYGLRFKSERELISEDLLFNFDYLLHATNVITIPDVYYNYRSNPLSLTSAIRPDRIYKNHILYQYILEILITNNFGEDGYMRATRLFIGYTRYGIRQYIHSSLAKKEKMQWLKEVSHYDYWKKLAKSYPYKKLPLKYALHFYLMQKGWFRLLYYYSKL